MSKKYTVTYTIKDDTNLLVDKYKHFTQEGDVIDFVKKIKNNKDCNLVGKPTIVINQEKNMKKYIMKYNVNFSRWEIGHYIGSKFFIIQTVKF